MKVFVMPVMKPKKRIARMKTFMFKEMVAKAADVVAPVWPLKTFIAVNPLQGLVHLPFEQAVIEADRHRNCEIGDIAGFESVNRELIKWCSAYFDEGQALINMPGREFGFYHVFRDLARYDRRLNRSKAAKSLLASLPECPENAISESLNQLGIPKKEQVPFIR